MTVWWIAVIHTCVSKHKANGDIKDTKFQAATDSWRKLHIIIVGHSTSQQLVKKQSIKYNTVTKLIFKNYSKYIVS